MFHPLPRWILLSAFLPCLTATAQVKGIPAPVRPVDPTQATPLELNQFLMGSADPHSTNLQSPEGPASRYDLKPPWKARTEYNRGYQSLLQKDPAGAVRHLTKSIAAYPKFVAAHNALGTAYMYLQQNQDARSEFAQAVALDQHLPSSYLNLGCAELALKQYADAEESIRMAASLAPLDLHLQLALTYAEYMNRDYPAVLATSRHVHEAMDDGVAEVHLYAAAAWVAQGDLGKAQQEMETLLREDPLSESAGQYRQMLERIEAEEERRTAAVQNADAAREAAKRRNAEEAALHAQLAAQQDVESRQIDEAEAAADPACVDCDTEEPESGRPRTPNPTPMQPGHRGPDATFRVAVNEVSVFFAATNHGKPVTDLTASDLTIRDDRQPPTAILGFRNESQLPLRLGMIIDTSDSVTGRFSFEQEAAARFLQRVLGNKDDLAFVVGVNASVLFVQDFTADQKLISHAVNELAPKGGTALWDAVAFAADKLADRPETQPVARILVVISDGDDNSSRVTLKQAIASAQRGEVAVYTVNSRDATLQFPDAVGDRALEMLSELTGGTGFKPGTIGQLSGSLAQLQQVIRGRYLVSYKPASFQRDDRYRSIEIAAQKDGHKLRIFARKGYYASATAAASANR